MILSCDPGIHGALALRGQGALLQVWDMPLYTKIAGARGAQRDFIDGAGLLEIVQGAQILGAETFIIEEVSGLPGQSAAGAFVFGQGYGEAIMAARACGLALERVKSSVWKLRMRCPADKSAARIRATELMPEEAHRWPLKKHDGRAEAAMIGLFAERFGYYGPKGL